RKKPVAEGAAQLVPVADMIHGKVSRDSYPLTKWGQCFIRGVTPQPFDMPVRARRSRLVRPPGHREPIVPPGARSSMASDASAGRSRRLAAPSRATDDRVARRAGRTVRRVANRSRFGKRAKPKLRRIDKFFL